MKILFVCSSNIRRSQMAQVICEIQHPEIEVRSAGFSDTSWEVAQQTVEHIAKNLGEEYGQRLAGRRSRFINEKFLEWADVIFVMEPINKEIIECKWEFAENKTYVLSDFVDSPCAIYDGINAIDLAELVDKAILKLKEDCIK